MNDTHFYAVVYQDYGVHLVSAIFKTMKDAADYSEKLGVRNWIERVPYGEKAHLSGGWQIKA